MALKDQGYLAAARSCLDCGGPQQPRGERAKGGRDAGRLGGQAGKAAPKGCRGAVDQEARQEPLYKNHVNVDRRHKLVRRYHVSDAAEHDSQVLDDILDGDNTALGVWADSAYRSAEIEAALKEKGLRSRIHRKGRRNKPLSEREKQGNKTRSSVRVRVEHVFGAQSNARLQHAPPGPTGASRGGRVTILGEGDRRARSSHGNPVILQIRLVRSVKTGIPIPKSKNPHLTHQRELVTMGFETGILNRRREERSQFFRGALKLEFGAG